ncbi:MAG: NYN domain-containing protein [Syntrophobacterales bacterium]|nr:NYN domain-containing protein [Syntrophobacterales bacterium]
MRIIIDGYNLIRQSSFRQYERISLEAGRKALIRSLAAYRKNRGHSITVVFDGWIGGSPNEERDRSEGVEIIYSRIGEKADEVIKRLAETGQEEITVVTSDREIATHAAHRGKSVISSSTFEALLEETPSSAEEAKVALPFQDQLYKRKIDEDEDDDKTKKKGPARRLSRHKRLALAALRKL